MATLRAAVLVAVGWLVASPALAQGADALLDEGRRHHRELEYLDAIDVLSRVLALPDLSDAQRAEALELLGSTYVVLDREREAHDAFESLFAIDPYRAVSDPTGSPKITRFVARVRAEVVPDAALVPDAELRLELPRAARVGEPTRVRLVPTPSDGVDAVHLLLRGAGDVGWTDLRAEPLADAGWEALVPGRERADELELYALARDAEGRVLVQGASPLSPLVLAVRLDPDANLAEQWWLWTAIGGGVLVAVIVGVAVGLSSGQSAPSGTLPPGRVELP